ncbi:MAG: phosphoenolpyruvate synthase [Gemmatimonadota bacterium]
MTRESDSYTVRLDGVSMEDVSRVGGKNASLGEMIRSLKEEGVPVPDGFATTADAYRRFLSHNELDEPIQERLDAFHRDEVGLAETGKAIRELIRGGRFPDEIATAIREAYAELGDRVGEESPGVAVRSSATAEDLPEASFAGQQESFLNVSGEERLLDACRACFASLYTDRAITYRENLEFEHAEVALSVGVQLMVRSDRAGAGVLFTLDPDTGFPRVVVINAAFGLGESVVKGTVDPDQYVVFKPVLDDPDLAPILQKWRGGKEEKVIYTDASASDPVPEDEREEKAEGGKEGSGGDGGTTRTVGTSEEERRSLVLGDEEILQLARWGKAIEEHYGRSMDVEWAKDGETGELWIVQARPETVESRATDTSFSTYTVEGEGKVLVTGTAVGSSIATARVCRIENPEEQERFEEGAILVTERTDPDWGPILGKAAGVITDHGSRTSHAAIVSRELGIPAVVGSGNATEVLEDGQTVTLSCAEGDEGKVYEGEVEFIREEIDLESLSEPPVRIMINAGNPDVVFRWWRLPTKGIGLARIEFIIGEGIQVHPMALLHLEQVEDGQERERIEELLQGWESPEEYFIDQLARGIARLAASCWPEPAVIRTSDFKTNEYAALLGGGAFEPREENPMLGLRGAARYYNDRYRDAFLLECRALKRARDVMGLDNVIPMIPFCRTVDEADRVLELMGQEGLERGKGGLEVYVMCEVPSNVILAEEFAERFDGFSIGSNDLTQLLLGVDRDSQELAALFDERDDAVMRAIADVIARAHEAGVPVGICGQAPSDHPEFARFLVERGIDSMSLNPDSVVGVLRALMES